MAIYKHGQGFELETAKNKARESPERDLNLGLPDCEWLLTTRPCCLLNRDLKKTWEQSFFNDMQVRLNKIWHTWEKNFSCEALVVTFQKKNQDFLPFFQDFTSIFQTFSRFGKLLGKFQEFKTLYKPCEKLLLDSNQHLEPCIRCAQNFFNKKWLSSTFWKLPQEIVD